MSNEFEPLPNVSANAAPAQRVSAANNPDHNRFMKLLQKEKGS
jgi:hypothetical protein